MASWLISALRLLGVAGAGFAGGQLALAGAGGGVPGRRRRRRALTASDKSDISFMAAVLGETAARKFALILASRPR